MATKKKATTKQKERKLQAKRKRDALVKRLRRRGLLTGDSRGYSTAELKAMEAVEKLTGTWKKSKRQYSDAERKERKKLSRIIKKMKAQGRNIKIDTIKGVDTETLRLITSDWGQEGGLTSIKDEDGTRSIPWVDPVDKLTQLKNVILRLADDIEEKFGQWDNEDIEFVINALRTSYIQHLDKDKVESQWIPSVLLTEFEPPSDFVLYDDGGWAEGFTPEYLNSKISAYLSKYMS